MSVDFQLIGLVAGAVGTWSALLIGVIKFLLVRVSRDLDARLDYIARSQADEVSHWRRIERDLMDLRAEMPTHYVRREDHIRNQSVIEAKLDALANELKQARLEGAKNGRSGS